MLRGPKSVACRQGDEAIKKAAEEANKKVVEEKAKMKGSDRKDQLVTNNPRGERQSRPFVLEIRPSKKKKYSHEDKDHHGQLEVGAINTEALKEKIKATDVEFEVPRERCIQVNNQLIEAQQEKKKLEDEWKEFFSELGVDDWDAESGSASFNTLEAIEEIDESISGGPSSEHVLPTEAFTIVDPLALTPTSSAPIDPPAPADP
ncbi:Uncharacterized protein Fot_37346 [Forsythia ovata]|uniref:Uncharacterized protein n=1 Tax=Forsythia ovata TaxID=205694 RepID=A0ABD1S051_9LAMI